MFFCEECKQKNRWPGILAFSYGKCEVCGKHTDCYDVPSKYLPIPELGTVKVKKTKDVHTAHCCQKHGCKYAMDYIAKSQDCTVVKYGGQESMCSYCWEEIYDEGGWEDAHLLNELYNKGRLNAYQEIVKMAQMNWELKA